MKKYILALFMALAVVAQAQIPANYGLYTGATNTFNSEVIGSVKFGTPPNYNSPSEICNPNTGITNGICTGYSDYTTYNNLPTDGNTSNAIYVATVTPGQTYSLVVKGDDCIASTWVNLPNGTTIRRGIKVFVDWNDDGIFNTFGNEYIGSQYVINQTAPTFTMSVTIPTGVTPLDDYWRMRIIYVRAAPTSFPSTFLFPTLPMPAAPYTYGETEDYDLTIQKVIEGVNCVDVSCHSLCDGSFEIIPDPTLGGTTTYSISSDNGVTWSVPSTATVYDSLCPGSYIIGASNSGGLTDTATAIILEPAPLLLDSALLSVPILCDGDSSAQVDFTISGGTTPYSFIYQGDTTVNPNCCISLTGLPAGNHVVTIVDTNGCEISDSILITEPDSLFASVDLTAGVSCFGQNDAEVEVDATGGTGPYQYSFDNSAFQLDSIFTNVAPATYNVAVMDANGCTDTLVSAITVPGVTPVQITTVTITSNYNGVNVSCADSCDGEIEINASGGTPYSDGSYHIFLNGNPLDTAAFPYTADSLCDGTINVMVSDSNNCISLLFPVTLTEPNPLVIDSLSITDSINCYGYTDGEITANVSGGTGVIQYSLDTISWQSSSVFNNLAAGQYYVYAEDANGCTYGPDSAELIAPPLFVINTPTVTSDYNGEDISCVGMADGEITITVTGGTGPYEFSVDSGQTFTSSVDTFLVVTGLSEGTYYTQVEDANGCLTAIDSVTLSDPDSLGLFSVSNTNFGGYDISCFGANDGEIELFANGGVAPYQYMIVPGTGYGVDSIFTSLTAGTYDVAVMDDNGCSLVLADDIILTEPTQLQIDSALVSSNFNGLHLMCAGDSTGEITIGFSGGTPFVGSTYNIYLNNVLTTQTVSPLVIANLPAGTYDIAVEDSNGCQMLTQVTIIDPTPLSIDFATVTSPISCFGDTNAVVTVGASGGTGNWQYNMGTGYTSNPVFANLSPGTYAFFVMDDNGCTDGPVTTTVVEPPLLVLDTAFVVSNYNGSQISCTNSSDGQINVSVSGGTPNYLYSIDGGASFGPSAMPISNLAAGNYDIMVQDVNGCEAGTISVSITAPAPMSVDSVSVVSNYNGAQVSCFGVADAQVFVTASGGTDSSYVFTSLGALTATGSSPQIITAVAAGLVDIIVYDVNGCPDTMSVNITSPQALTLTTAQIDAGCNGSADGTAWVTPTGGTPGYQYLWSDGQTDSNAVNLPSGMYTVTVTDTNGCTETTWVNILEPYLTMTTTDVECWGFATAVLTAEVINGNNSYTYDWSSGHTTPIVTGVGAGTYTVTVTDPFGCELTATDSVWQPEQLIINMHIKSICKAGDSAIVEAEVDGGFLPYSFSWSNGSSMPEIEMPAGTYILDIVDDTGCVASQSATVLPYSRMHLAHVTGNATCIDGDDGFAWVMPVGGYPPYSYLWFDGQTDSIHQNLSFGLYDLTVTDDQGCVVDTAVAIGAYEGPCLEVYNSYTPNGDNTNDYWHIENIHLYPDALVEVYNRWGDRVFAAKNYTNTWDGGWNGFYKGELLPSATYYYVITLHNGQEPYKGTVTIVR
jgi:gliding motility-associated-like protein